MISIIHFHPIRQKSQDKPDIFANILNTIKWDLHYPMVRPISKTAYLSGRWGWPPQRDTTKGWTSKWKLHHQKVKLWETCRPQHNRFLLSPFTTEEESRKRDGDMFTRKLKFQSSGKGWKRLSTQGEKRGSSLFSVWKVQGRCKGKYFIVVCLVFYFFFGT